MHINTPLAWDWNMSSPITYEFMQDHAQHTLSPDPEPHEQFILIEQFSTRYSTLNANLTQNIEHIFLPSHHTLAQKIQALNVLATKTMQQLEEIKAEVKNTECQLKVSKNDPSFSLDKALYQQSCVLSTLASQYQNCSQQAQSSQESRQLCAKAVNLYAAAINCLQVSKNWADINAVKFYRQSAGKCYEQIGDFNKAIDVYTTIRDFERIGYCYKKLGYQARENGQNGTNYFFSAANIYYQGNTPNCNLKNEAVEAYILADRLETAFNAAKEYGFFRPNGFKTSCTEIIQMQQQKVHAYAHNPQQQAIEKHILDRLWKIYKNITG